MTKSRQKNGKNRDNVKNRCVNGELGARDAKTRQLLIDELLKKCAFYTNNTSNKLLEEHEDINSIIENLIIIEKDITIPLPKREHNWDEFVKWCEHNSIDTSKVVIDKIDEKQGYGLRAARDIDKSELIMTIPRNVMITCETAVKEEKLASFIREDPLLQHMPNIVLALHIINEYCKPNSFWRPYLSSLPSTYSTTLYMDHEEIKELQGSQVLEEVIKLKRSIARQYAYFSNQMQINETASKLLFIKQFTYELYRWAVSTVMTRQNVIPSSDGTTMISALIPLWDICNHRNGEFSTEFNIDNDSVFCHSMNDFKCGEEISIYYGPRSNGEFFAHNGFVYAEHDHDFISLKLGISRNDLLFQLKHELCTKLGLSISGSYHLYHSSHAIDKQLLAFLRIFHFNKEELESWLHSDDVSALYDFQQLAHMKPKLLQFLSNRSVILLNGYRKQSPELSAIASSKCNNNLIDELVKSEKNILMSYIL